MFRSSPPPTEGRGFHLRPPSGAPAPSAAVAIGKALEPIEKKEAEKRMKAGTPSAKLAQGRSRDKVAAAVGMSHGSYEKAKAVVESGNKALVSDFPLDVSEASCIIQAL